MTAPFIELTLPAAGGLDRRPIFVNVAFIREISEKWQRHEGVYGRTPTSSDYEMVGTYVTTGSGEDGTYAVIESYDQVASAIRGALA